MPQRFSRNDGAKTLVAQGLRRMLADGAYNVIIVDASDDARDASLMHLSLTILDGAHKSDVVTIDARDLARGSVELFGLPGTLVVRDGTPTLHIEG